MIYKLLVIGLISQNVVMHKQHMFEWIAQTIFMLNTLSR